MKLFPITRLFWRLLYDIFAARLPRSHWKILGQLACKLRWRCVKGFVTACGENVLIENNVILNSGISIGNHVEINENCVLSDMVIGDYCLIGPQCYVVNRNHEFRNPDIPIIKQGYQPLSPPVLGRDVWLGVRVTLLPGVQVGDGAVVAAGCVVNRDVPPGAIVGGVPARIIGWRRKNE